MTSPPFEREQDRFDPELAAPNVLGAWAPVVQDEMGVVRVGCAAGVLHDGSLIIAGGIELNDGGAESGKTTCLCGFCVCH